MMQRLQQIKIDKNWCSDAAFYDILFRIEELCALSVRAGHPKNIIVPVIVCDPAGHEKPI